MDKDLKNLLLGRPKNIKDPNVFERISLVAFLAWVGLGADGLSSSAYGPDEAFRALGSHTHLAIFLVLMIVVTITVISAAYSNLIEHFPGGGGGYLVATKLLGEKAGVVSGCALLVDYVLTISVSIAAASDALWSFLPTGLAPYKLIAAMGLLVILVTLNMRGIRESVAVLAPIFLVFLATHAFMIFYAIGSRFGELPAVFSGAAEDLRTSASSIGIVAVLGILFRAYAMGAGTYTGIEAVSNGISMLREPRVRTGKRTMLMMGISLAFTAGGIMFGYLLAHATPVEGKTMNAVLLENLFATWQVGNWQIGGGLIVLTLVAEAALLVVAAQTGLLGGPRVLANMALDSWMPHRFSQLSDRLVTQNGVLLMGLAAFGTLIYTRGDITTLVVMYSINVFLTFTLTELGMFRHWVQERGKDPRWKKLLTLHGSGLVLCACILTVTIYEKFTEGGWVTLLITGTTIMLCFLIRRHYRSVTAGFKSLDDLLASVPPLVAVPPQSAPLDKNLPTAILTVQRFSGFGLHQILSIQSLMPGYIKNYVFISAAVVDTGNFKGAEEITRLEEETRSQLEKYVLWSRQNGLQAEYRLAVGTEPVDTLEKLCLEVSREFKSSIVFTGKLIFREEKWYQRLLHNETAAALQRRLQFRGLQTIVLPIRVLGQAAN